MLVTPLSFDYWFSIKTLHVVVIHVHVHVTFEYPQVRGHFAFDQGTIVD